MMKSKEFRDTRTGEIVTQVPLSQIRFFEEVVKYQMVNDPGHGWLRVPEAELIALGIAGEITFYSYMTRDRHVWLEEDCDLSTFLDAKLKLEKLPNGRLTDESSARASKWFEENVESVHINGDSPIRHLKPFIGGWKPQRARSN